MCPTGKFSAASGAGKCLQCAQGSSNYFNIERKDVVNVFESVASKYNYV
jgi:hypothetical protein